MLAELRDSLGQIPGHAVFFGVLGGLLWGFGPLGKRYSVAGAHPKLKAARSAGTYFVCSLGAIVTPAVRLAFIEDQERLEVLSNESWRARAPFIVLAGAASGLGGLMGTCALALANANSTALITMIENGTYAVMASMFIAGAFQEHPAPLQYVSAAMVVMGILIMQADGLGEGTAASKGTASDSQGETECLLWDGCDSSTGMDGSSCNGKAEIAQVTAASVKRADCKYGAGTKLAVPGAAIFRGGKERKAHTGASSTLAFAIAGGALWAIGPLGKRWGVDSAPVELRGAYASCTSFLFTIGALLTSGCAVFRAAATHPEGFFDPEWAMRVPLVLASGALSGLGGFIGTYALALVGHEASSVVAILENGVFTVAGALLIAVVFREQPTTRQICGALPIVGAVFLAQLA